MKINKNILTLLILLLPGLVFRFILAPYTTGSDIPQFAGFADTFLRHGLSFYMYCDGSRAASEGWAYGWPYVYGPLLILVLGLLRLFAPGRVIHYWEGSTYYVYAPIDWIIAVKTLYILFDTLVALAIYFYAEKMGVRGKYAYLASIIYYYNPMTIYISSIYGMFDQIPLFFYITGLYTYTYHYDTRIGRLLTALLFAVSIGFKPTMIYPFIILAIDLVLNYRLKGLLQLALITGLVGSFYAPFFIYAPQSLWTYLKALRSVSSPTYASPIVYTFNGFTAIVFLASEHGGYDFKKITTQWIWLYLALLILIILAYLYEKKTIKYTSLGYIAYTASYWRVNFQYLVPTTGFTILLMLKEKRNFWTLTYGLLVLALIGLWPLMYPVSWWAHVHIREPAEWVIKLLDSLSLMIFDEVVYVIYAVILTLTQITLITCATLRQACKAITSVLGGIRIIKK